jgi:hypothetical protein
MRICRTAISAAFAAGLAALPLSTAKAQSYPHRHQPTAQGTADQLNREEAARHQSGNGYSPYYWAASSPWGRGWGYPSGWGWGYPACSSPFPLFWPFCVVGAVVGTAALIVTSPVRALTEAPPYTITRRRITTGHAELARLAALPWTVVNRRPIQKTNSRGRVGCVRLIYVSSHFDRRSDVARSNSLLAVRRAESAPVPEYLPVYFPVRRI